MREWPLEFFENHTPVSKNSSVSSGASSGSTQAFSDFLDFASIRFPHADMNA
jgi:hypothetical protein